MSHQGSHDIIMPPTSTIRPAPSEARMIEERRAAMWLEKKAADGLLFSPTVAKTFPSEARILMEVRWAADVKDATERA